MEHFCDHLSARVTLVTALGALVGTSNAMLRGYPILRTAGLTAISCAMCGTICLGSERIAAVALERWVAPHLKTRDPWEFLLTTHVLGGLTGGGLIGELYIRRPIQGMIFFTPLMMMMAVGEKALGDMRQERIRILEMEEEKRRNDDGKSGP